MHAVAFDSSALLSFFRGQLNSQPLRFTSPEGELALLAPPAASTTQAACEALDALRCSGEIKAFHPIHTPAADAFLVELEST